MSGQQSNGNSQLNEARDGVNKRADKKAFLGKTKRRQWAAKRRYSNN
jgi:hypothetical protein